MSKRIMYPEEAVEIVTAMLDHEAQSGRFDAETVQALEVLTEIAEDYYTAAKEE